MKSSGLNDEKDLLILMANNDEMAFRSLYQLYYQKIFKQVFFLTKDKNVAEDAVQEIFVKIWVGRAKLTEVINLDSYINVITRNHVYNYFRKLNYHEKYIEHFIANSETMAATTAETVNYNELHQRINLAVSKLPRQQRRVYELSRSEGLRLKEIAHRLNISKETVKKYISEALKSIKTQLKDYKHLIMLYLFGSKK